MSRLRRSQPLLLSATTPGPSPPSEQMACQPAASPSSSPSTVSTAPPKSATLGSAAATYTAATTTWPSTCISTTPWAATPPTWPTRAIVLPPGSTAACWPGCPAPWSGSGACRATAGTRTGRWPSGGRRSGGPGRTRGRTGGSFGPGRTTPTSRTGVGGTRAPRAGSRALFPSPGRGAQSAPAPTAPLAHKRPTTAAASSTGPRARCSTEHPIFAPPQHRRLRAPRTFFQGLARGPCPPCFA
mmetsp:Transcript_34378/g.75199  ORF Transcript_34378/g.75199 Transcript_34378/m.75199 type:complete len:242 (-) Transcript_34378:858-1583(-)